MREPNEVAYDRVSAETTHWKWQIGHQGNHKASAHRESKPRLLTSVKASHQIEEIGASRKRQLVQGVEAVGDKVELET